MYIFTRYWHRVTDTTSDAASSACKACIMSLFSTTYDENVQQYIVATYKFS